MVYNLGRYGFSWTPVNAKRALKSEDGIDTVVTFENYKDLLSTCFMPSPN